MICVVAVNADGGNPYTVVDDDITEVVYRSPKDVVCRRTRQITCLDEKGLVPACFGEIYYKGMSELTKFSGVITYGKSNITRKLKKSDLKYSSTADGLASDEYSYVYELQPSSYPFTVTYKWEEHYSDGILSFPIFMPQTSEYQRVNKASYSLAVPNGTKVLWYAQNFDNNKVQRKEDGTTVTYSVECANIDAIEATPFSQHPSEQVPKVFFVPEHFEFGKTQGDMTSWQTFGMWRYQLMKDRDILPAPLTAHLDKITKDCKTDMERIEAIYSYLGESTRYVSIQLGIGGLQPMTSADVYQKGYGDCKALSYYMMAMLKHVGVKSYCAILNTDRKRLFRDFASANQSNHEVLCIPMPKDTLWVECTSPSLPLGFRHGDMAGHDAILIDSTGGHFCTVPDYPDTCNAIVRTSHVTLMSSGKADVKVEQRTGYHCIQPWLSFTERTPVEQREHLRRLLLPSASAMSVTKVTAPISTCLSHGLDFSFSTDKLGNTTGNRMFLPTAIFKPTDYLSGKLANDKPIVIDDGRTNDEIISITLPEGYDVEALPKNIRYECEAGRLSFECEKTDNCINVRRRLDLYKGNYPQDLHDKISTLFSSFALSLKNKIIIKKR